MVNIIQLSMSGGRTQVEPSKIIFLIDNTIPYHAQQEDIILLHVRCHSTPQIEYYSWSTGGRRSGSGLD